MRAALTIAVLLAPAAFAQAPRDEQLKFLDAKLGAARGARTLGVVLTLAGTALVGGGGLCLGLGAGRTGEAFALPADAPGTKRQYLSQATTFWGLGAGLGGAGLVAAVVGLVFWANGQAQVSELEKKQEKLMFGASVGPGGASLQLTLRW